MQSTSNRSTPLLLTIVALLLTLTPAITGSVREATDLAQLEGILNNSGQQYTVVAFYSPYCHTCHKFRSILDRAGEKLPSGKKPVQYVKINAYNNPTAMPKYHISTFPAVFLFEGPTQVARMPNDASTQEFLVFNWIKKNTGMPGAIPFFAHQKAQPLELQEKASTDSEGKTYANEGPVDSTQKLAQVLFNEIFDESPAKDKPDLFDTFDLKV